MPHVMEDYILQKKIPTDISPPPPSHQGMGFSLLQSSMPPALQTLAWRENHWFPCKMRSKKRVQKIHTDDTSLPSAMSETWLK